MDYATESLRLHSQWKGKIEVVATVPMATKEDLPLAHLEIELWCHGLSPALG